jgi:UDP-GlcNAc:undecaprenyl-phosphate/decaprenyl-phosphate GlcNAc-1-phosphate transferase
MSIYVYVFALAVGLSALLTRWVRNTATNRGLKGTPVYGRHTHTLPVPRLGGIAIFATFLLAAAAYIPLSSSLDPSFSIKTYLGILGPVLLIFAMGVYDDLKPLKPIAKVAVQALAATFLYLGGVGIHFFHSFFHSHFLGTLFDLPLTLFWVLLITNAFNLIDGLDGLAAGSAGLSALMILVAAIVSQNALITFLVVAFLGAILGFLPFNRHPASIFMGDSGSLFIGFFLSALSMGLAHKATTVAGVAVPLLAFGLPILDVSLAVSRRFLSRRPLFRGDTDHIHHRLIKHGFSHAQAVDLLYAATATFVIGSLILLTNGDLLLPVLFVLAASIGIGIQKLHYQEFSEVLHPVTRRRVIVTDDRAILRAVETLATCADFRGLCQILQEILHADGMDAMRVINLGSDGYPMALLHSLRYDAERKWYLEWSERKSDSDPWEFHFELPSRSYPSVGYAALLSMQPTADVRLNYDLLAQAFKMTLTDAVATASVRMTDLRPHEDKGELDMVREACRAAD